MLEILNFFPKNISNILSQNIGNDMQNLEEIRIRAYKPIILKFLEYEMVLEYEINRRRNN